MRLGVVYKVSIGNVFVIGSTIRNRTREGEYRRELAKNNWNNTYLQNSYNKYGKEFFKFEVLQKDIPEDLLLFVEDIWMGASCAMVKDRKSGVNIRPVTRNICSEEAKYNNSISKLGDKNPMFGRKGKNNPKSKPIFQYDLNGNFIKQYDSIKQILENSDIKYTGNISSVALGNRTKAYNYLWFYDYKGESLNLTTEEKVILNKEPPIKNKPIIAIDKNFKVFKEYKNVAEANLEFTGSKIASNINRVLKGKSNTAYGFMWGYKNPKKC